MEKYLGRYALRIFSHATERRSFLASSAASGAALRRRFFRVGMAGIIEFFGGLLVGRGLNRLHRLLIQHFPKGFWPIENDGELAVLYCFIFIYMAAVGSGG